MSIAETGQYRDQITEANFGELFLLAYADYLRSYDQMQAQVTRITALASGLGDEAVNAFIQDPSVIDVIQDQSAQVDAIFNPLTRAAQLDNLAARLLLNFESGQPVDGFYNPRTDTRVQLPYGRHVSAKTSPRSTAYISTGLSYTNSASGSLRSAGLKPFPISSESLSLPTAGRLTIASGRKGRRVFDIKDIIERRTYTSQVELSFEP
jgi:hypothetical protein